MPRRSQLFILPILAPQRPSVFSSLFFLTSALYAPFLWILFINAPWDDRRIFWLKSIPALPGFFIQTIGPVEQLSPTVSFSIMGSIAFFTLLFALLFGRQSRPALVFAVIVLLAFSSWNSWIAYQSFLSI